MRSLYAKIFLWFWLAMVLVIGTLVFSIGLTQSKVTNAREEELDKMLVPLLAERCAKAYEEQGKTALSASLKTLPPPRWSHAYFFGEDAAEILGQAVPNEMRAIVQRAMHTDDTQIEYGRDRRLVAQSVLRGTGKRYVLLLEVRSPVRPFLQGTPRMLAIRLISVLMVAALLCLWLARYITAPVIKLRKITRQLAEGNLGARVGSAGVKRRDEIADLGRDFDNMAERLEGLMLSQRRLMTDISHELRSPLARLSVALGLAWRSANPEIESSLEHIERETDRLNELIGALLSLARLESGAEPANREAVNLEALTREVIDDANFEAQSRNVRVRMARCQTCSITGIRGALRSALENVLRNAVNYTAVGTEVEVTLDRIHDATESFAVIQVRDHGDGVPEELLGSIFKPFYRVADARERSSGGTGLGLTITDRIVHLHGGTVTAWNSKHGGLVVELRMPLTGALAGNAEALSVPLQAWHPAARSVAHLL
jgi:signal transduction histidine kinase